MLHCLWRQYKWCWQTVCAFCPYNACIKPCQHTCHKRSLMLVNVYESTVIDLKIPCCLFVPMSRWVIIKYLFVSWNTCRGSNIVNIKPLLWTKCQKKKKVKGHGLSVSSWSVFCSCDISSFQFDFLIQMHWMAERKTARCHLSLPFNPLITSLPPAPTPSP